MAAKRILVDTNVALDWLIDRKPWSDEAKDLWESRDAGESELCLAASVLDTIHYIIRKGKGYDTAKQVIQQCVETLVILPVDLHVVELALSLPGNDFEDNILIACAMINGLDLIVTRDPEGFKQSSVTAIDPKAIRIHLPPA